MNQPAYSVDGRVCWRGAGGENHVGVAAQHDIDIIERGQGDQSVFRILGRGPWGRSRCGPERSPDRRLTRGQERPVRERIAPCQ